VAGAPGEGRFWVYVPAIPGKEPGAGLPPADIRFPVLESYIDVVVEGALEYGPEFAREIIVTTKGWSEYWLNDRELARRPWVFDSRSAAVDKILAAYAPDFAERKFPEEFAAKYLLNANARAP
jgi:hypothetical protein